MSNTSATGGYLTPTESPLDINAFMQKVIVGITGLQGQFVRPRWQGKPAGKLDPQVNWMGFGLITFPADANPYVSTDQAGVTKLERQEYFQLACTFYGPAAYEYAGILRDGLQIAQNRAEMDAVKIKFIGTSDPQRAPELVNTIWINRTDITLDMVRYLERVYPIEALVGAEGTIVTDLEVEPNTIDWTVEPVED